MTTGEEKTVYNKKYYQEHKLEIEAQKKEYCQANKVKIAARKKRYSQDHKENLPRSRKEYQRGHGVEIKAKRKKYYQENKVKIAVQKKTYYQENKVAIKAKRKKYQQENKKALAAYRKEYYQENKETLIAYGKTYWQTPDGKATSSRHTHKRRAQKMGVLYEIFDPQEVFERDGWRCQHCYKKVQWIGKSPRSPLYPNLDHIVPLSKGGEHTKRNTQLLCRGCNSKKHTDDSGEQLRLFG